jgi:hypothetical protein
MVGQDHMYTVVCTVLLAGKSPKIRSYTVYIRVLANPSREYVPSETRQIRGGEFVFAKAAQCEKSMQTLSYLKGLGYFGISHTVCAHNTASQQHLRKRATCAPSVDNDRAPCA